MASQVPYPKGRLWWPDTDASIPANWSRDTAFDDRHCFGDGDSYTGPADGGNAGHTHDPVPSHTHGLTDHQHNFSAAATSDATSANRNNTPQASRPSPTHDHVSVVSEFHDGTSASDATVSTINVGPNSPRSLLAIVIQPDNASQNIPDDAMCLTDETVLPTGFSKISGSDAAFLRAPTTGADGGSISGNDDHSHASGGNHTHTFTETHGHAGKRSGAPSSSPLTFATGVQATRTTTHHVVTLSAANPGNTDIAHAASSSSDHRPPFINMLGILNTSGGATTPLGVIIPYVGSLVDPIPDGWSYCDGTGDTPDLRSNFIKTTTTDGVIGNTGGATTHTHATAIHTHDLTAGHTHGTSVTEDQQVNAAPFGSTAIITPAAHTHVWTVQTVDPGLDNGTFALAAENHIPANRSVVFLKKTSEPVVVEQPAIFMGCNF